MKLRYLKNVSTLRITNPAQCTGCGMCMNVCPHQVLEIQDGKVMIREKDACMECGACSKNCPFGVLEVRAGVGCASAVLNGIIYKGTPTCGCGCSVNDENTDASCCDSGK